MQACHAQKVSQYTCQSFNILLKVILFGWLVVQLIQRSALWPMKLAYLDQWCVYSILTACSKLTVWLSLLAKLMQVRIVVYEMASLDQRRVLLCSERAQMKGLIFLMHFLLLQALYLLTKYSSFFEEVHIWYYFIAWTQYKSTIMLLWLFCSLVRSFLSWLPECVCQPLQPSMTSVNVPTYQTLVQVKYWVDRELFALLNCRQFTIHIYIH